MRLSLRLNAFTRRPRPPARFARDGQVRACVYLLADHLDATLAAGEDLLRQRLDVLHPRPSTEPSEVQAWHRQLRGFLEVVRGYELTMLTRLMQARQRADEVRRGDSRLATFAALFHAGTTPLADTVAQATDPRHIDFDEGAEAIAFLKARAILAADCDGLDTYSSLEIADRTLVAGVIPLGVLLDHVVALLDALELHYDLFAGSDEHELQGAAA